MRSSVLALALCAICLLAVCPAYAQETQPGDACTAGETDYIRQVGGPETTGVTHLMRCNGSTWVQLMTWLADGKVGIGTDSPTQDLHVHDTNADGNALARFTNTTSGNTDTDGVAIGYDDSAGGAIFWNRENSPLVFSTNNTEWMRIDANGNVGIGTTTPESALHVPDGKYAQFQDFNAGAPPAADCDNNAERGRLSIDTTNNRLYVCNGATRGWDYAALTN